MDSQGASPAGTARLALFPLNVVLFPGGLLPLRIFEPRYLRMVSECLRNAEPFVVAPIVDGPEAGGIAHTAGVGTLAEIVDWEQLEDGLLGLLCEGGQRVAIEQVDIEPDSLARASVGRLPHRPPQPLPDGLRWMGELLTDILQQVGTPFDRLDLPDPSADHVAGRLIELLPLSMVDKRALFGMDDSLERLQRLAVLIGGAGGRPG